ncbi:sigma-70 family RNA polymerase sigma factor [Candidatus Poribacteria bacterium]|nr:sigma-70 family RNA polymerase sigma factor [Candidatus Poribacteria bacterium]MYF55599.1 sigma-70 family RNA polymerase sigma factor [Candidatus Poribacteria bacterium]
MERTEALLIDHLREGDETALAPLVEKYKRMVHRLAMQITKNHEDANDVMQETFIKVYQSIHTFRQEAAFETWVYRIAVNEALNFVKRRERRRESSLETTDESEFNTETLRKAEINNNPEIQAEKAELRHWVTKAVNSLSLKHRIVVILHELEGLTHAEIASILNCSEGTVRSRLHYARKQLRSLLKPYVDATSEL